MPPPRHDRPGARGRRRRAGVLERAARGVPRHPRAALLVPQAGQCACRAAEVGAPRRAGGAARTSTTPRTSTRPRSRSRRSSSTTAPSIPRRSPRSPTTLDVLLEFYNYPAEHWIHLRTTNPIESTFATVRLAAARHQGPRLTRRRHRHGLQAHRGRTSPLARRQRTRTWSPSSEPARSSTKANCSNGPLDITPDPSRPMIRPPNGGRLKHTDPQVLTIPRCPGGRLDSGGSSPARLDYLLNTQKPLIPSGGCCEAGPLERCPRRP